MSTLHALWSHRFFRLFILGCGLFTVLALMPREQYGFWIAMLWNLFLVVVPLVGATLAYHASHRLVRIISWVIGFFFLPNTWYVLTDIRHLIWLHPKPEGVTTIVRSGWDVLAGGNVWMSELMLFILALLGIAGGAYAGYMLIRVLMRSAVWRYTHITFHILAISLSYLSGFAIYIGRYIRHNSWDIVVAPGRVASSFIEAHHDPQMLFVTLLFGGIAYVSILVAAYLDGRS